MTGLHRGMARTVAVAGTATAVSSRILGRQPGRWEASAEAAADDSMSELTARRVPTEQGFQARQQRIGG
jgi:hypothetical protein